MLKKLARLFGEKASFAASTAPPSTSLRPGRRHDEVAPHLAPTLSDALDTAIYKHPRHQPRQLRMSRWTLDSLRLSGLADDEDRAAGFRVIIDNTMLPGLIQ